MLYTEQMELLLIAINHFSLMVTAQAFHYEQNRGKRCGVNDISVASFQQVKYLFAF